MNRQSQQKLALHIVCGFYKDTSDKRLYYHDYKHTTSVIKQSQKLASKLGLQEQEKELLFYAALFHDVGYLYNYYNHEEQSVTIAQKTMKELKCDSSVISEVCTLIRHSHSEAVTTDILSKALNDADLSTLGLPGYFLRLNKLRKEWEHYYDQNYSIPEWVAVNIQFVQKHRYYTQAAEQLYEDRKQKHLKLLKQTFLQYIHHS